MADRFTIVGGRGFVGGALAASLRDAGHAVQIFTHRDDLAGHDLGHVVYASGVAASATDDAAYAVAAHVTGLANLLAASRFESLLYLSSTRVYGAATRTDEDAPLTVHPTTADTYRITKIAGEALALAQPNPAVRVARLSNVAGPSFRSPLFLSDVLRQAARSGRAEVRTLRASAKDYVTIADVCRYLVQIARGGRARVYNVAAGRNTENGAIYDVLTRLGVTIAIAPDATVAATPPIDARRVHAEFGPPDGDVLALVPELLVAFAREAAWATP